MSTNPRILVVDDEQDFLEPVNFLIRSLDKSHNHP
jgi:hypothetical protein